MEGCPSTCLCCKRASSCLSVLQGCVPLSMPSRATIWYVSIWVLFIYLLAQPSFVFIIIFMISLLFLHLYHLENFHLHKSVHISLISLAICLILDYSESPVSLLSNKTNPTLIDYLDLNLWPILFTLSPFFAFFQLFLPIS